LPLLGLVSTFCTKAATGQHVDSLVNLRSAANESVRVGGSDTPRVCTNPELLKAIRIIDRACNEISCDFSTLRELNQQIDKGLLLQAFRNPELQSVHIFFPINKAKLDDAFDWRSTKRDQIASLKYISEPDRAVVYVLGRASTVGNRDLNVRLSRERMRNVLNFLKNGLGIRCHAFHGGWFGQEIQQLSLSDARMLNIEPLDFRNDSLVLNQSVHIFVFPCAELL